MDKKKDLKRERDDVPVNIYQRKTVLLYVANQVLENAEIGLGWWDLHYVVVPDLIVQSSRSKACGRHWYLEEVAILVSPIYRFGAHPIGRSALVTRWQLFCSPQFREVRAGW
jgi:hypothetical protein